MSLPHTVAVEVATQHRLGTLHILLRLSGARLGSFGDWKWRPCNWHQQLKQLERSRNSWNFWKTIEISSKNKGREQQNNTSKPLAYPTRTTRKWRVLMEASHQDTCSAVQRIRARQLCSTPALPISNDSFEGNNWSQWTKSPSHAQNDKSAGILLGKILPCTFVMDLLGTSSRKAEGRVGTCWHKSTVFQRLLLSHKTHEALHPESSGTVAPQPLWAFRQHLSTVV